nr:hypothetical protein [Actinomycetota bacterium]
MSTSRHATELSPLRRVVPPAPRRLAPVAAALEREGARLVAVATTWLMASLLGLDPVVAGVLSLGVWGFLFGWRVRTGVAVALLVLALAPALLLAGAEAAGERAAEAAFYVLVAGLTWALPVLRVRFGRELLLRRESSPGAAGEEEVQEDASVQGRVALRRLALAAGLYAAATAVWLFPTVSHLTTSVPGTASTSIVTVRELWANEQEDSWPWNREERTSLIGAPEGIESPSRQLSLSPFTVLPQIALKTFGQLFGWFAALNLYIVLGFVAAAAAMFLLLDRLGVGFGAALFGGYVWGFSPQGFEHALGRLELVPSFVLPLLLWSLLRFRGRRSPRSALVPAALLALCWYSSPSFALLATWLVLVFAAVDMLLRRPHDRLRDAAVSLYALAAGTVLMLVPAAVAWAYSSPSGGALSQPARPGASLWQYLLPSARHPLLGEPSASYERRHELPATEPSLFFGYVTIVLAISALVLRRRAGAPAPGQRFALAIAAALALSSLILSLPPIARLAGTTAVPTLRNPLPDTAEIVPPFASFGLLVGLGLVI